MNPSGDGHWPYGLLAVHARSKPHRATPWAELDQHLYQHHGKVFLALPFDRLKKRWKHFVAIAIDVS